MDIEAKTKMNLDTRQAKRDIRSLERDKRRARRQQHGAATRKTQSQAGSWRRRVGVAAGFAAGYSAMSRFRRVGAEGIDPWSEALTPIKAAAQYGIDKATGGSARAKTLAREETREAHSTAVGGSNPVQPSVHNFFQKTLERREREAKGLNLLRMDPRFGGPSFGELVAKSTAGYIELIRKAFATLGEVWIQAGK